MLTHSCWDPAWTLPGQLCTPNLSFSAVLEKSTSEVKAALEHHSCAIILLSGPMSGSLGVSTNTNYWGRTESGWEIPWLLCYSLQQLKLQGNPRSGGKQSGYGSKALWRQYVASIDPYEWNIWRLWKKESALFSDPGLMRRYTANPPSSSSSVPLSMWSGTMSSVHWRDS